MLEKQVSPKKIKKTVKTVEKLIEKEIQEIQTRKNYFNYQILNSNDRSNKKLYIKLK
jgi:hypothetical protein